MARQQGTYKLASNIEPRAAAPLDAREKVALKNDLTATGTFPYPYEGMEVYVVEEKKKYVLIGNDPTVSENWQEVGNGGGGDVIEYVETLPTGNDIQNKIYNAKTEGEISLPIIESLNHNEVIKYYEGFLTSEEIGGTVPTTIFYPKEGISISRFIKIKYVWYSDVVNYVSIEGTLPEGTTYHLDTYSKTDTDYPRYSEKELTFEYVTNDKYYAGDNTNQTLTKLAKQENASNIFTGTHSEWDAMSIIKKQEYDYAAFTDDESDPSVVVDAVTDGDMRAVTSNAVYDEFKKVQPQTYECYGCLVNSLAGEITGYGRATVTLKDGVAEIKFSVRIHTNDGPATFNWGLNRDLLHTLLPNLPVITPIGNYSNLQFFAGTGAVLIDLMGYGAMASSSNQFWVPARMYQIDGSTGTWGTDRFPINSYITGTVYGVYAV